MDGLDGAASVGEELALKTKPSVTKPAKGARRARNTDENAGTGSGQGASSVPGPPAESGGFVAVARPLWTKTFLPTLYNDLFCSKRPFEDFQKGGEFIKRLQGLVNIVYPGSGYQAKLGDDFCQMVCLQLFLVY
jgi:hypothetical protein